MSRETSVWQVFALPSLLAACFGSSNIILLPVWSEAVAAGTGTAAETLLLLGSLQLAAAGLASLGYAMFALSWKVSTVLRLGTVVWIAGSVLAVALLMSGGLSLPLFALTRILAGIGEGLILASVNARVTRSAAASRFFLLNQLMIGLYAALLFAVLPLAMGKVAPPAAGIFALLAVLGAVLLLVSGLVDRGDVRPAAGVRGEAVPLGRQGWALLAMFFFFTCGFSLIYSSWGRLGLQVGMSFETISGVLGMAALVGMAGLLAAMLFARRIGLLVPITVCLLMLAVSALVSSHASLLEQSLAQTVFRIAVAVDQVSSLVICPFVVSLMARHDPSGRTASAAPLALMAGGIVGPLVSAAISGSIGATAIGWGAIVFYLIGVACVPLARGVRVPATA